MAYQSWPWLVWGPRWGQNWPRWHVMLQYRAFSLYLPLPPYVQLFAFILLDSLAVFYTSNHFNPILLCQTTASDSEFAWTYSSNFFICPTFCQSLNRIFLHFWKPQRPMGKNHWLRRELLLFSWLKPLHLWFNLGLGGTFTSLILACQVNHLLLAHMK